MAVYVELEDIRKIEKRLGLEESGEVQTFFTNTCYREMEQFVPMDNGNLRTIVNVTSNSITYQSPYASYQYYGQRKDGSHKVVNYTTPNTGSYWDKRMMTAKGDEVIEQVKEEVRRLNK